MQNQSPEPTADWMSTIPKDKKIGLVVPLYGYWGDIPNNQLDWQTLSAFLTNLNSKTLKAFTVFIGESHRLSRNVQNVLVGRAKGGGMEVIDVDKYSTYGEYIKEGIDYLLDNTDCEFIVIANPWVMLRSNSVDQLAERLNSSSSSLVCGFDLRKLKWGNLDGIPAEDFETFNFNPPMDVQDKEFYSDFWGMTRQTAQVLKIDPEYKTIFFQSPDIWGSVFNMGFGIIASQYIPFYSFEVDWKGLEPRDAFEDDKQRFTTKWKFVPTELVNWDDVKT